jgi:copper transport protein
LRRRRVALLAIALVLGLTARRDAWAHAGVRQGDPAPGSALGDTPTAVILTLWEKAEPSLSVVRVLDTQGSAHQIGRPEPMSGQPLALVTRVGPLGKGVYTVSWRLVSAVDGHATTGSYSFGVGVMPSVAASAVVSGPSASPIEIPARFLLISGLVLLLGAAGAGVARFGGPGDLRLAAGGWILAVAGLLLLALAQRANADASFASLFGTSIGRSLVGRAAALLAALGALLAARPAGSERRRAAMGAAGLAAAAAMALHVAAGHAGASSWAPAWTVLVQWAHFGAIGVWLGGLAALLLSLRGAPSAGGAEAARRFSRIATVGLLVAAVTGATRAIEEFSSWGELLSTGYGRAASAKIAILLGIAALGAFNRWKGVPAAATTLRPLRRAGTGELALAAGALLATAVLGAVPTPAAARLAELPVLRAAGVDFGTTVRVRLATGSNQPGPNRFTVNVEDYDSKTPVGDARVGLRFTPLDDPGVAATSLALAPGPGGTYVGSGPNLAFDGRWRLSVLIQRGGGSVEVPLEVEAWAAPPFLSVERPTGQGTRYTLTLKRGMGDSIRFAPDSERPGRRQVYVTFYDLLGEDRIIDQAVVTAAQGDGPVSQVPLRRIDRCRFVAEVDLAPGRNRLAAVGHANDGTRLRAAVDLDVPAE